MIPAIASAECTVRSGPTTNVLVELFTSEGCDSCPPADRWFSRLGRGATGPQRTIPLAFHVDYWDYIGWKDRFGNALFTERQRALAKAANSTRVYTPQVVVAGRDFPPWRDEAEASRAFEAASSKPARAMISVVSRPPKDRQVLSSVAVSLVSGERAADTATFVAVVESGLSSRVTAGENRGATLLHDHVVRELIVTPSQGADTTFANIVTFPPERSLERSAIVVFVQNLKSGEILQALRAPICRP